MSNGTYSDPMPYPVFPKDDNPYSNWTKDQCRHHIMQYTSHPWARCEGCSLMMVALQLVCIIDELEKKRDDLVVTQYLQGS